MACLDDDKYALDPSDAENVIEFIDPSVPSSPAGSIYPVWTSVTEIKNDHTFGQTISYSGPRENNEDIELTVDIDPVALTAYNENAIELGAGTYTMMPDSYYEWEPLTLTIPKGQSKVTFSITVHPNEFDLSRSFALPLRITSATSGILSEHFSAAVFAVVVKNDFDGIYAVTGGQIWRDQAAAPGYDPALSGNFNAGTEIPLGTIDAETSPFSFVWKDGSGIAGIDNTRVRVIGTPHAAAGTGTVPADAVNIQVRSTANPALVHTPGQLNYYSPGTRTFVMNVNWGVAPSTRRVVGLTMVYDRPRP